jgi:hypothetical protein
MSASITTKQLIAAYLCAVTSASFCAGIYAIGMGLNRYSSDSFGERVSSSLLMGFMMFAASWIGEFISMIIPYMGVMAIAKQLKIKHWTYYVVSAILLSVPLMVIFVSIPPLGINVLEDEPSFWVQLLTVAPLFFSSAAIAGFAVWWCLREKVCS